MPGGFSNKGPGGSVLTSAELLWVQTGAAGVVLLAEQSSSPSATTGYGKLYAKTDGNLYFLNESGSETQLGAGGGSSLTVETPTGTVNGSNTDFTVTTTPKFIVADGVTYFENNGYTRTGTDITMDVAPSQYIRAII